MTLIETAQLLGDFGEFFGAIAVVATLGYLAVQIRQNTRSTYVSRHLAAAQQLTHLHDQIMGNKELADLVARCRNTELAELSPGDEERVRHIANFYINTYSGVETAYQGGGFPEYAYTRFGVDFRRTLTEYPALTSRMRAIVEQFDKENLPIFKPLFE